MTRVYGRTRHDVERAVGTHLFGIAPNNSGSTFLKEALATCRATWNLQDEGQHMLGFAGPATREQGRLIWSTESRWLARLTDPRAFDWPHNAPGMVLPGLRPHAGGVRFLHQGPALPAPCR